MKSKEVLEEVGMGNKERRRGFNLDHIGQLQGKLFSIFFLVATMQVTLEVIMRYVFNSPTSWGLDLSIYLCGVTYVMGGGYTQTFNEHIRVDIFYSRWSERTRAIVDLILGDCLFLFVCGILVWQSSTWAWESFLIKETAGTVWDPPIYPFKSILVLGSVLLLVQAFSKIVKDFKVVTNRTRGNS